MIALQYTSGHIHTQFLFTNNMMNLYCLWNQASWPHSDKPGYRFMTREHVLDILLHFCLSGLIIIRWPWSTLVNCSIWYGHLWVDNNQEVIMIPNVMQIGHQPLIYIDQLSNMSVVPWNKLIRYITIKDTCFDDE